MMNKKQLVVVLGMHRSGTSALTRGLTVLGVELGEHLMPAQEQNNAKGFWEDVDINQLNIELMQALQHGWDNLSPLTAAQCLSAPAQAFLPRAKALLQQKMAEQPLYGIKDPRVSVLLPFWQQVFSELELDVRYVIALRSPLSVASSLAKRDDFVPEKSHALWLLYMLACLEHTQGSARLVVDFDQLMAAPAQELSRVAELLQLEFSPSSPAFSDYSQQFLDPNLRHASFSEQDTASNTALSDIGKTLYHLLRRLAQDELGFNDPQYLACLGSIETRFADLAPALRYAGLTEFRLAQTQELAAQVPHLEQYQQSLEVHIVELNDNVKGLVTYQGQIEQARDQLQQLIGDQDQALNKQRQALAEKDQLIAQQQAVLHDSDQALVVLRQTVSEQQSALAEQAQAYAAQEQAYAELAAQQQQQLAEHAAHVAELNHSLAEQSQALAEQQQLVAEQQAQLHNLHTQQAQLYNSASWRLTSGLRQAKRQWRLAGPRLHKLKKLSTQAPAYLRQAGGVGPVSKKLRIIWAQEGWAGVKHRLKNRLPADTVHTNTLPNGLSAAGDHQTSAHQANQVSFAASYLQADLVGNYQLSEARARYCYVPPARPLNLDEQLAAMQPQILFSIVVPVYNTPPDLLDKLLASVEAQWYPHWELILADDCSPSEQTQQDLAAITNEQVVAFRLEKNSGIAGATNAAIAKAKGEFVVLLDHDDELTPDCLYELALCIKEHNPDYIYSDEDKIDAAGHYADPHFKPDWSPDTMMSTMYVCHVVCIRHSVLEAVGGLRSDYDGCQDWDLILRVTEHTNNIRHIPKVLYHWRIIEGSVAADIAAKPYVRDASIRVRQDALTRRGLVGTVETVAEVPGYFRVNYHPQGEPLVSIIIPTRDNYKVLRQCLDSLLKHTAYRQFEVLVIDNGSVEPNTLDYLASLGQEPQVHVIRHDMPFNFSELNNIGVQAAKGEIFLFLNDDTEVLSDDWLARMVGYAQLPHVGAVGAKLLYPQTRTIQHAGVINLELGPHHAFLHHSASAPAYFMRNLLEYNWLAVTGACLMVERTKFAAVGGFDESFPVAYNDIDLCFSLHAAGFYQVVCQAAVLLHHESVSRGHDNIDQQKQRRLQQEKQRLFAKHPAYFQYDPFYSPNLHPHGINFDLAL